MNLSKFIKHENQLKTSFPLWKLSKLRLDSSIKTQTQIHNGETTKPTEQNINLKVSFHSLARNQCENLVHHGIQIKVQQNLKFNHLNDIKLMQNI